MSSYRKGRNFEYAVKHSLEKAGYIVIRSAGSHGVVDLVAFKPDLSLFYFIQCKLNKPSKVFAKANAKCVFIQLGSTKETFKYVDRQ